MLNLDYTLLQQVADQALADAAAHPRWVAAIGRALVELDTNPYLEWTDGHLLIASPSGVVYAANGICQCQAFTHGQPCWHRAASRLVRRYHEAQEAAQRAPEPAQRGCGSSCATCPAEDACAAKLNRKIAAARIAAQFNAELFA